MKRRQSRAITILLAALLLIGALAGCGGGNNPQPSAEPTSMKDQMCIRDSDGVGAQLAHHHHIDDATEGDQDHLHGRGPCHPEKDVYKRQHKG